MRKKQDFIQNIIIIYNIQLNIEKFKKDIFLDKTKKQLNEINRKLNKKGNTN